MKKNWKRVLWWSCIILTIVIIVPFIAQLLTYWNINSKSSGDGWLGFWGNYLGAIIGILGAVLILKNQFQKEATARKKDKTDNTFFNLLQMHNDIHDRLKKDSFEQIHTNLIEESHKKAVQLEHQFIIEHSDELLQILAGLNGAYHKFSLTNKKSFNEDVELQMANIDTLANLLKKNQHLNRLLQNNVYHSVRSIFDRAVSLEIGDLEPLKEYQSALISYRNDHEFSHLENKDIAHIVESTINSKYHDIGSYIRFFHQIIKYINDNTTDEKDKNEYLGFLRANIDEMEILVLFYLAVYTDRGLNLLEEFSKTEFFGNPHDFIEGQELPFINRESLIWKKKDLEIMKNLPGEFMKRSKK